ncbi:MULTISPECIES: hypothetical protein [unclassified Bradyrhizobium]|uniref:hypothetical protein n=1 Tax=unclassified Bradyrhizobium TaxID=2631580 RepID=UPI002916952C|nr:MULTISPECIES: hypothetical protein [unclassified Bradyrhizobium]
MATTQTSVIKASISVVAKKALDGRDVADRIPDMADIVLSYGAGYGKADIAFSDDRALSVSTSENLDLSGALVDAFGQTINAGKIKAIMIDNQEASGGTLTVGAAASNTFNGPFSGATMSVDIKPGDRAVFVSRAGWPVTAATGDILKVACGAQGSAVYRITIVASSS